MCAPPTPRRPRPLQQVNEDPKDAMLRQFQEEIARLKSELGGGGASGHAAELQRDEFMFQEMEARRQRDLQELDKRQKTAENKATAAMPCRYSPFARRRSTRART